MKDHVVTKKWCNQQWQIRSNAEAMYHLERQGRTALGVVPFIGAGISTAFGLKNWKGLLLEATPSSLVSRIQILLNSEKYEKAAEILLRTLGADGFQNMVAASAGDSIIESFDFSVGVVSLLPLLANGPVITTNFDRILEKAFEANNAAFESVISGPRPDLIVDALLGNRRVLVKLHGDWQDRVGRTFAQSDYEANYGEAQPEKKRELLDGVERLLFSSRSLLFIGASLATDRTVGILRQVHHDYAGIRHFAVINAPATKRAFEAKEELLRSCGILPIWYQANDREEHIDKVERVVRGIVERISVKTIRSAPKTMIAPRPKVGVLQRPANASPPKLDAHFDRIVRLLEDGRLTFFVGSGIYYPQAITAVEFSRELAKIFECESMANDPFAVAQFIADRHGRVELYAEIRKLFDRTVQAPQDTHELFAAWTGFKSSNGEPLPFPLIITTNYDAGIESRLARAGLPYHILSYQSDGPYRGKFYHRDIDDSLRIIEIPRTIQSLADGFVVVKVHGGREEVTDRHAQQFRIPESYVTTRLDYWNLATRIPDVFPAIIQDRIKSSPLLFLGHGLGSADVESLVRFAHKDHPGPRSWAVTIGHFADEYWHQCGLDIISEPVNLYVIELGERLRKNGAQ